MRSFAYFLLLFFGLALFGGFAYLTRHPESPWLEKAQSWPFLGELAHRFRRAYLGPASGDPAAGGAGMSGGAVNGDAVVVGEAGVTEPIDLRIFKGEPIEVPRRETEPPIPSSPPPPPASSRPPPEPPATTEGGFTAEEIAAARARGVRLVLPPASAVEAAAEDAASTAAGMSSSEAWDGEHEPYVALEWVWFQPGNTVRAAAAADAASRATLRVLSYLPVLARDGTWVEVVHRRQRGWIDTAWEPAHRRRGARRGILRERYEPVRGAAYARLQAARKLLGVRRPARSLGAYDLYTDVEDEELLSFLDSAAAAAENAYFARYARLPSGDPDRSVVLFAAESSYREYSAEGSSMPSDTRVGHAGGGVLAFYAEGRSREELARTMVHEIGHLLNNRAVAWRLPSWLEEGLASDLGALWVESAPGIDVERRPAGGWRLEIQGPEARMLLLDQLHRAGELPSIDLLWRMDREVFQTPEVVSYAYAHSFAVVRFLLEGDGGRHAEAFRLYLKRIAGGSDSNPKALLKKLELEVEELDRAFRAWLEAEIRGYREQLAMH